MCLFGFFVLVLVCLLVGLFACLLVCLFACLCVCLIVCLQMCVVSFSKDEGVVAQTGLAPPCHKD